jgi:hypothetical protein
MTIVFNKYANISLLAVVLAACQVIFPQPTPTPTVMASQTPAQPTSPLTPEVLTQEPANTPTGSAESTPHLLEIPVYFTSVNRYALGTPPYEVAVARYFPQDTYLPEAILTEFFNGTTPDEEALGLQALTSGFTGLRRLEVADGIAHVFLDGECNSLGATYTIAQPIMANLFQFPEIRYVKIYDAAGSTGQPTGPVNSIPECLEP